MTLPRQNLVKLFAASLFTFTFTAGQAASVYLTPASSTVISPGTTTLELFMDFTGDPTVGGGIDLDLSSGISVASFTPSAYWVAETDPFFSDYGTADADADYEIHFGNFAGLVGVNKLGDLTINLLGLGSQSIAMNINTPLQAGLMWPHQCMVAVLLDRQRKSQ